MFEAFLSISYGVVSSLIYDLMKGNKRQISEIEINYFIEKSIDKNIDKYRFLIDEKDKYYNNLLQEIKLVISNMEYLSFRENGVILKPSPNRTISHDDVISNLVKAVEARKNELGLINFEPSSYGVSPEDKSDTSKEKLESLLDRINKRRIN